VEAGVGLHENVLALAGPKCLLFVGFGRIWISRECAAVGAFMLSQHFLAIWGVKTLILLHKS
jgi:hypothetical protein